MADPITTLTGFSGVDPPEAWPLPRTMPQPQRLELGVDVLPGIGTGVAKKLGKLGLRTVGDLLRHRPFRYEPVAPQMRIVDLFGEDEATVEGTVRSARKRRVRRLTIVTARVVDESGEIDAVWFNQEWLAEKLRPGTRVRLRGHLGRRGEFAVKSYDLGEASATADHAPVYSTTEDLAPKRLRASVESSLAYVVSPIEVRSRAGHSSGARTGGHGPGGPSLPS